VTFAREGALVVGCDVAVDPAEGTVAAVHAAGAEMVSLQPCRLGDPAECAKLVELAIGEFGRIDVLFNLAARSHFFRLEDFTDAEWDAARRDEVDLVFYLTRAAWPHLKASHGVVVNMASLNGSLSFKALPSLAHTTNKAAIIGMTRQLALEGSESGIRVNSISPGFIESGATRGELEDGEFGREMRDRTLKSATDMVAGVLRAKRAQHGPAGRARKEGSAVADPTAREFLRRADPILRELIDARADFHPRAWLDELPPLDAFGTLIFQVVGQQLSVSATRTIVSRLQQRFGGRMPSPHELLEVDPQALRTSGMSNRKGATLRALAERFIDGRLSDESLARMTDEEIQATLTEVPGIGPWTAHGFLIGGLDRPDVLLSGDLALRRAVQRAYGFDHLPTEEEMVQVAERWRPYRSLAASYLFASALEKGT
jgi:3-methyladenine DNA glycosylase/8-oxoguanine DNA glycosylase